MRPTLQQQLEAYVKQHATGSTSNMEQEGKGRSESPPAETRDMTTMDRIAARVAEMVAADSSKPGVS
jgi:hypothetical protein